MKKQTLKEIRQGIKRMNKGEFVGEEEFLKDSPLNKNNLKEFRKSILKARSLMRKETEKHRFNWKGYTTEEWMVLFSKETINQVEEIIKEKDEEELKFLKILTKLNKPTKESGNEKGSVYYWNDKIALNISERIKKIENKKELGK